MSERYRPITGAGPYFPVRPVLLLASVLVIVAGVYSPSVGAPFTWDDWPLIVEQPLVHDLQPGRYFAEPFWASSPGDVQARPYYRPIITLSYAIDWWAGNGDPRWFHAVNLLAHLLVTALVFLACRTGGASGAASGLAAAVFGLAPRLSESVAWVSGRTDVFAAAFTLGALVTYERAGSRAWVRMIAGGLLLLGLLSKEVAVAGVAAILAWELARIAHGSSTRKQAIRDLAPVLLALTVYLLARGALRQGAMEDPSLLVFSPGARALLVLEAVGRYALMLADPFRPRLQIGEIDRRSMEFVIFGGVALLAGLLLLAVLLRRRWRPSPEVAGALALMLGSLAPVLHLVPFSVNVVAADRFLYLPWAGLLIVSATSVREFRVDQRRVVGVVGVCVAMVSGLLVHRAVLLWGDEVALWGNALATSPTTNSVVRNELGNALSRAGRAQDALPYFQDAVGRSPASRRAAALSNLATTLSALDRVPEAREIMEAVLRAEPSLPVNHLNLGIVEARGLRFDGALSAFHRARELSPGYNRADEALRLVEEARASWSHLPVEQENEPTDFAARRASVLTRLGNRTRAAAQWARVLASADSTLEHVKAGALIVVQYGTPEEAAAATAAARRLGAPPPVLALLQEEDSRRFGAQSRPQVYPQEPDTR